MCKPFAVIQVANCLLWMVYGMAIGDVFVWLPNIAGLVLGLVQCALLALYPDQNGGSLLSSIGTEGDVMLEDKESAYPPWKCVINHVSHDVCQLFVCFLRHEFPKQKQTWESRELTWLGTWSMELGICEHEAWSLIRILCSVILTESKYTGISISSYERQYRNGLKCLLSLCLWPCGEAFSHWLPLSRLMRSSHSERFQRVHTRVCMCVRMYVCTRVRMSFTSWHCVRVCHLCLIVCMHAWHAYTNECPYVHG